MKFRQVLVWWIHKSLLHSVLSALGIGLTSLHDAPCLRPVTLAAASGLVVWPFSDSIEMGKRAQNKKDAASSAAMTTPVKKVRQIKSKLATPSKVSRELSRTKSDEAAARAVGTGHSAAAAANSTPPTNHTVGAGMNLHRDGEDLFGVVDERSLASKKSTGAERLGDAPIVQYVQ